MENSYHAFKSIIDIIQLFPQYHFGVEFDIRLTSDNQYIIYHDEDLFRLHNLPHKIKDLSVSQIKQIDDNIITLDELNELYQNTNILINIEIKEGLNLNLLSKYFNNPKFLLTTFNINIFNQLNCNNKLLLYEEFDIYYKGGITDYQKKHLYFGYLDGFYNINNLKDFLKIYKDDYKYLIIDNLLEILLKLHK